MKKAMAPLRKQIKRRWNIIRNAPLIIYFAVLAGIAVSMYIRRFHDDFGLNLVSEILGAAFTLFVIDVLLVRTKTRQWSNVQHHIDYLISRTVSRLRDGLTGRAFAFKPGIAKDADASAIIESIRVQRDAFFHELNALSQDALSQKIQSSFFSEDNYQYFNEKADEVWNIVNMKYSEYLAPALVVLLMELHTQLKDLCAHIRVFRKGERLASDQGYYEESGRSGAAHNLKHISTLVVKLKEEGFSTQARKVDL